jgi:endoglucanase
MNKTIEAHHKHLRLTHLGVPIVLLALLAACGGTPDAGPEGPLPTVEEQPAPTQAPTGTQPAIAERDAFAYEQNRRLGRGVNLGNALEAPREGEWGVTLEEKFFATIKAGGFDSLRVPIRWNAHAALEEPYTIEPAFFERIDWVVDNALENDLAVILNIHHYEEMMSAPKEQRERFLAIWRQIAGHYQDAPDSVFFELLNEPNSILSAGNTWNELAGEAIQVIRQTNPRRTIVVGPVEWNSVPNLHKLQLPEEDRNLIVTFHYYLPFNFTHQGAEWVDNMDRYLGTTWTGSSNERGSINFDLDLAANWGKRNARPIFMGEFGAYSKADMDSRALWTAHMARQAEARGISWAYWEFCAGFGVYDRATADWVGPLHEALIP